VFNNNSWSDNFTVAAGSVTGREHLRLHRNNQDGLAVRRQPHRLVAALADGCSSGRSNEVGARLATGFVAAQVPRLLDADPSFPHLLEQLSNDLFMYLEQILSGLGGGATVVQEHLLFTLLVAVLEPERTLLFGLGDGIYAVDDEVRAIGPYPGNAPPYFAYRLVDSAQLEGAPVEPLQILHEGGPAQRVVLASDGLTALATEELLALPCSRNPSLLQKRLNVWERRFSDDASAIVLERAP
jgi:hypothetical protein